MVTLGPHTHTIIHRARDSHSDLGRDHPHRLHHRVGASLLPRAQASPAPAGEARRKRHSTNWDPNPLVGGLVIVSRCSSSNVCPSLPLACPHPPPAPLWRQQCHSEENLLRPRDWVRPKVADARRHTFEVAAKKDSKGFFSGTTLRFKGHIRNLLFFEVFI